MESRALPSAFYDLRWHAVSGTGPNEFQRFGDMVTISD
jgi:hypothetical protein